VISFESDTLRWLFILFEALIGLMLIIGSRSQPFPRPAQRFGTLVIVVAGVFALGQFAPSPVSLTGHLVILTGLGSFGLLAGIYHLVRTRREVLIAPFSGFLFCVGVTGLMVQTWDELNKLEHWAGFISLVVLGAGQTWLVFRGLLIGRLPLAWSQAGMVALYRGKISGPDGAIACFEKGWDAEEEHLNPMAYLALHRLNLFIGDDKTAEQWFELLMSVGGEKGVAIEWIEAIHSALYALDPSSAERLPVVLNKTEEE
tara:strand:- start:40773 stop:41546 length:774 start_codon:yes stop_codon:yes gene_type:complete